MALQKIPKAGERSEADEGAMKMQEIPKKGERSKEDEGTGEPVLEVKIEEEAEPDIYTKLQSPSDDIYSEYAGAPTPGKQTEGNPRPYRAACFFLSIICLVLLVVVIFLSMKLHTGSTVCPERGESTPAYKEGAPLAPICTHVERPPILPIDPDSWRCPDGWRYFDQSCFYMSTFRLNWDKSQSNCTTRGGALAVVTSLKLQNFLVKKGRMTYWIGLRRKGATWTWVNNTVLREEESYWENEPEWDCVILSTKKQPEKNWLTSPCKAVGYFICQLQL